MITLIILAIIAILVALSAFAYCVQIVVKMIIHNKK